MSPTSALCCREIQPEDGDKIIDLLTSGFNRKRQYWLRALQVLTDHPTPAGYPKYGHLLESDGAPVGVLLQIFTAVTIGGERRIRCNVSSWYVKAAFRSYAAILAQRALRYKAVTYFNISPAPHTWRTLEAQGYTQFAQGSTVVAPILSRASIDTHIAVVDARLSRKILPGDDLSEDEISLLLDHAIYGCLSIICVTEHGRYPFVFGLHRRYGVLPVAQLIYCRSLSDFVRFAQPIGKCLGHRGYGFVSLASNGPVTGLFGKYFGDRPKYMKGPGKIPLGDVAYSEQVMFGY